MRPKEIKYQLEVFDSLFDPYENIEADSKPKAYYRERQDGETRTVWYKVWLYLDGPDLPFVKQVTYFLHPSFPNPKRTVTCTPDNPKAAFFIWTWGVFTVEVEIEDISGRIMKTSHYLTYDSALRNENIDWVKV